MDKLLLVVGILLVVSYLGLADNILDANERNKVLDRPKKSNGRKLNCHHYSNKRVKRKEIPCISEDDFEEDGSCNKTQECVNGEGTVNDCFIGWTNDSGVITIVNRGCWTHNDDCISSSECIAYNNSARKYRETMNFFFCCCNEDFCNDKMFIIPGEDEEPVTRPDVPPYNEWMLLAYILVPLFGICCLVICGFYLYRRHKLFEDMDGVSVNTPATATTRCTMQSFAIPSEITSTPQLIELKARGRFGCVWKAQLQDHYVAVKTFTVQEKQSWRNEQDIFTTPLMNTHENILRFLKAVENGQGNEMELWLITDFYERGSLTDFLKANTVTLAEAMRILETMARGTSFLHEDIPSKGEYKPAIAHRDFKSKNVLLNAKLDAVIADFGLAVKFTPGESTGESHGQVGTRRYMAPEVLEGAINFQKDAFLRIDMYAFGLVMWEIISRCTADTEVTEYKLPFEDDLGIHPTMELMQERVVEKKLRPYIKEEWKSMQTVSSICETMEECWDHDAEARLSAGCVEQRMVSLLNHRAMMDTISNEIHGTSLMITPPACHRIDSNTEKMNQINIQMNNINNANNIPSTIPDKNQRVHLVSSPAINDVVSNRLLPNSSQTSSSRELTGTSDSNWENKTDHEDYDKFANEETLSHDGVMERLIDEENPIVPAVSVADGNQDMMMSLLSHCESTI